MKYAKQHTITLKQLSFIRNNTDIQLLREEKTLQQQALSCETNIMFSTARMQINTNKNGIENIIYLPVYSHSCH